MSDRPPSLSRLEAPRWQRPTVILNRESGTIASLGPDEVRNTLQETFSELGAIATIHTVRGSEIETYLKKALDSAADAIIIGGGDGTVATAATLLAGQEKPLGILPLGTFNLAARDVGMPLDLQEAASSLLHAEVEEADLLDIGGSLYLCVLVLGFYPAMALAKPEYHGSWIIKALRSGWESMRYAVSFPRLEFTFRSADGADHRHRTRMAVIVNNDYEELFGLIPKRTSLNAGHMTVYVSTHRTRWGILKSGISWLLGRWKQDKEFTHFHATELEIHCRRSRTLPVMMDGEIAKLRTPLRVALKPRALRVLRPVPAPEPLAT